MATERTSDVQMGVNQTTPPLLDNQRWPPYPAAPTSLSPTPSRGDQVDGGLHGLEGGNLLGVLPPR